MSYFIEVKDLSISFKELEVLEGVNMNIKEKSIIGFEGINGIGKTVFLKAVSGFLQPNKGEIYHEGKKLYKDIEFPEDIGVCFDNGFISYLSAFDNLKLISKVNNKIKDYDISSVLKLVGLDPDSKQKYKHFSTGMKQKLRIAQAIMEKPKLLILDEVFNGLDKDSVKIMKDVIFDLNKNGATILMTSHIKGDLDDVCQLIYGVKDKKMVLRDEKN